MTTGRERFEFLVGLLLGGLLLAWAVVPDLIVSTVSRLRRSVPVPSGVPGPVVVGGILAVGTVVWLATTWALLRGASRAWARAGSRTTRLVAVVVPESPLWRLTTGLLALLFLVFVLVGLLPSLVGGIAATAGAS